MKQIQKMRFTGFIALVISAGLILTGCNASKSTKGAGIGVVAGGAIGALVGSQLDNTAAGAIIGATVGGTAGAIIGKKMDEQAEELEADLEGAEVERVGEGIKVTFSSGLLFDVGSSKLSEGAKNDLANMAETLKKYEDTDILIEGHTDSSGSEEFNQKLSEERANSVATYLQSLGVASPRVTTKGYGELAPVADNETTEGKQKNRRVEVAIMANEEMKKAAEDGSLD